MNTPIKKTLSGLITGLLSSLVIVTTNVSYAAQGDGAIAPEPLFLAAPEPPNIMLLMDSTGSMGSSLSNPFGGSNTRLGVLKSVFTQSNTGLFDAGVFDNTNVGLSDFFSFNCGSTACQTFVRVHVDIDDIDKNLNELKSNMNNIRAGGGTPLGTALQMMGVYFAQGSSAKLTLKPGSQNPVKKINQYHFSPY